MDRYPEQIRKLNRTLVSELGTNPRYSWRWSEDLLHAMAVVDDLGRPQYVDVPVHLPGDKVVWGRKQAIQIRKLLPHHNDQWVCCALVEVNEEDGAIHQTGNGAWVPISSSASGPAALPFGIKPTEELTQCVIRAIRAERDMLSKNKNYLTEGFLEDSAYKEKKRWNTAYDRICDASTAFYNVPGKRGHVSLPTVSRGPKLVESNGDLKPIRSGVSLT